MKKINILMLAVVGLVQLTSVPLAQAADAVASKPTANFVKMATIANLFEIKSSQLALTRSHNEEVKKFAQTMIDDHSRIGDNFKSVLQSDNKLSLAKNSLDETHQKLLDQLKSSDDKNFDSEYVADQADGHHDAVILFNDYAKHGDDAAIKNFAAQTLPTLEQHKSHVQQLKASF